MGFFARLFGGKRKKAPRGPPQPTFAPPSYPFEGEVRVRHPDYERLTTGWWPVDVATPEEWQAKVEDMRNALKSHFGRFQTQDGRSVPRWSEATWELVRRRLRIERK